MERPSKPPLGDFPAIGGRGRIDGDTYKTKGSFTMDRNQTYRRGDIFLADLDPVFGSEQGGTRPVLVLQNNTGNFYGPTLIVAPMTSNVWKKTSFPTHYYVASRGGLDHPSLVMLEQITTIDKGRLKGYLGQLNEAEMWGIDCKIEISLGLRGIPKCPKREGTTMRISKRDRYNGSGCLDTTAYLAMKNIAREETAKSQKEEQ